MTDTLTIEQAFTVLRRIDEVYMDTYTEYCRLIGHAPCGMPGYPIFATVQELATRIEERRNQINHYKGLIEALNSQSDTREREASAKIMAIVAELGIKL